MKTSPAQVQALECKYITQVQCGCQHTMALTSSGYVISQGWSESGQLGTVKQSMRSFTLTCLVEGLFDHND